MSGEPSGFAVKRRGTTATAAATPPSQNLAFNDYVNSQAGEARLHGGEARFVSPVRVRRGGSEYSGLGEGTPNSESQTFFSGSDSFAKEHVSSLLNASSASVFHRGKTAAATAASHTGSGSVGGVHRGASTQGAPFSSTVHGSVVRRLKSTWRRRFVYHQHVIVASVLVFLLLCCVLVGGGSFRLFTNTTASGARSSTTEDPALEAEVGQADIEDNLLDLNAMGPQEELSGDLTSWSVLIQHEDALTRLPLSPLQRACLTKGTEECDVARAHLSRVSLPSWTLGSVPPSCADCAMVSPHMTAKPGVPLFPHHAVVASPAAPLGRVGPMLFAMSSVTNEVPVREELAKWTWLRHVYPALAAKLDGGRDNGNGNGDAPRASYLAVMGVPSTDQPARVALRDAQRATWLTYQEVARTENDFTGALLPLYLFAAVEPSPEIPASAEVQEDVTMNTSVTEMPNGDAEVDTPEEGEDTPRTATTTTSTTTTTSAPRPGAHLCGHTDALLPTVRDYHVASHVWARRNGRNAEDAPADAAGDKAEGYVQRRVVLRSDYLTSDLSVSPCRGVAETRVTASSVSTLPLYHLSQSMGMNVTPAFVAAAEYICCASAGLWGEALAHRNVLWLDMMTDRRPTTKKKLGDTSKWGLPVEVGMSQKLILWLMYAYNSFTEVPYIIKGDDDMYLKVPQFLNDMRLLRRGARHGRLPPPPLQALTTPNGAVVPYADPDAPYNMTATECVYWGSTRRMRGVLFNAGMLFLLQRKLVGVVLERPHNSSDVDLLELASTNYSRKLLSVYKRASFDKEDVLMGVTLLNRQKRAEEVCARHRVWYGRESRTRFHDMRKGRTNPVTWATVVAHRCRPADAYLLHYFFTHELGVAQADVAPGESREEMAREAAATWAAETRRELGDDVTDWDALPEVKWMPSGSTRPSHWMAENDKVPVYNVSYFSWKDERAGVKDGYKTLA